MIPKSQYKIQYTSGDEFVFSKTLKEYVGYYIRTNDGKFYAGTSSIKLGPSLQYKTLSVQLKNPNPSLNVQIYNILQTDERGFKKLAHIDNTDSIPPQKKYPSEDDYTNGFYKRYFVKRINSDTIYYEVNKSVYRDLKNASGRYDYNLYKAGVINWHLTGNVYKQNALELNKLKSKFNNISYLFPLLNEFYRPDTLSLQENLYTEGGELYTADGEEYIGEYHIHQEQGPMIGAVHSNNPHPRLYYLNQLPSPQGMVYEEWLESQVTPSQNNATPHLPIRGEYEQNYGASPDLYSSDYNTSYNCVVSWVYPEPGYSGLTNTQGLIPGGASCIDPKDGTGKYKYSEYGKDALRKCQENCSSQTLKSDSNIGCLYSFDPNYCSECDTHYDDMCALTYYRYQAEGTCFCGNYGGRKFYAAPCCFNESENGPQDFDPTIIPGIGPSY